MSEVKTILDHLISMSNHPNRKLGDPLVLTVTPHAGSSVKGALHAVLDDGIAVLAFENRLIYYPMNGISSINIAHPLYDHTDHHENA